MKFASAAFGWKLVHGLYGQRKDILQWIRGVTAAVSSADANERILCDYTVLVLEDLFSYVKGIPQDCILSAQWTSSDLLRPAYYVVRDDRVNAVIICIRGTMSTADTLTDLAATSVPFLVCECITTACHELIGRIWPSWYCCNITIIG